MPQIVNVHDDCRAANKSMQSDVEEFTQKPDSRYSSTDATYSDPTGNSIKNIEPSKITNPKARSIKPASVAATGTIKRGK